MSAGSVAAGLTRPLKEPRMTSTAIGKYGPRAYPTRESMREAAIEYSRLEPDTLTDGEKHFFADITPELPIFKIYMEIRDHLITVWYNNPYEELTLQMALKGLGQGYNEDFVSRIFRAMNMLGHINTGIFRRHPRPLRDPSSPRRRVVVIGAGAAGLAAARQLVHHEYDVTVLEARDYPGGRIQTFRSGQFVADLGAMVITGLGGGNPLATICRQLSLPVHAVRPGCPLFDPDGHMVSSDMDRALEQEFNEVLQTTKTVEKTLKLPEIGGQPLSLGSCFDLVLKAKHMRNLKVQLEHDRELVDVLSSLDDSTQAIIDGEKKLLELVDELKQLPSSAIPKPTPPEPLANGTAAHADGEPNNIGALAQAGGTVQVPGAPAHDAIVFSNADIAQVSSIEAARVAAHAVAVAMEEATDAAPGTQANNAAGVAASGAAAAGGAPLAAAGQSGDGAPPAVPLAPAGSAPAIPPARLAENEPHSDNDELTATQASAEEIERGKQLYSEIQAQKKTVEELLEAQVEHEFKRRRHSATRPETYLTSMSRSLLEWHIAHLEFANATTIDKLSLQHWDQDDEHEFTGHHLLPRQGFSAIPKAMSSGLDVRYKSVVKNVTYSARGVRVSYVDDTGKERQLEGDAAVVTLPLGILKENVVSFSPPLPGWKSGAIERLGYGLLNKVALCFKDIFWNDGYDLFGWCADVRKTTRGELYSFWNFAPATGQPTLVALQAGRAAEEQETQTDEEIVGRALAVLEKIFGASRVTQPMTTHVTRWRKDPFARGSYSFIAVGSEGADYDTMARPVHADPDAPPRLYFAGEHTCRNYPATVHGAHLSGLREACRIMEELPVDLQGAPIARKPLPKAFAAPHLSAAAPSAQPMALDAASSLADSGNDGAVAAADAATAAAMAAIGNSLPDLSGELLDTSEPAVAGTAVGLVATQDASDIAATATTAVVSAPVGISPKPEVAGNDNNTMDVGE